jgi:hypothetical protein
MKRVLVSGLAAIALLAAATTMLRSHSTSVDRPVTATHMMSSQAAGDVNRLPVEEFEDLSLVYSKAPKR